MNKEPADEDRLRFEQMGITQEKLDPRKKKLFFALASLLIVIFLSGIFYTVFFYVTLPNHHTLSRPGQPQVDSVPLPVPPSAMFPGVASGGRSVLTAENRYFSSTIGDVRVTPNGVEMVLTLRIRHAIEGAKGISLILSSPPRWVDGHQGAMEGAMRWSKRRVLLPGEVATFPIHFVQKPGTPRFDLYIGFVGDQGTDKNRYSLHFSGLHASP